ncbi:alpha/beta-hydrolase [Pyrenochaeta sp. DS3sAY3a]|nr:alpha/beta-hydrolase [Pyrenochaeta sp. DS3sAY3a]
MAWPNSSLQVKPFVVRVPDRTLAELKDSLRYARIGPRTFENTTKPSPGFGLTRDWTLEAKDYWLNDYNWRSTEDRINSFDNYKATVPLGDGRHEEIHFLALPSSRPDAVPVVLLHGWPGSFLEFLDMLTLAKERDDSTKIPCTFIVPSLPGYAFSSGPSLDKPSSCEDMAEAVEALMIGLGYRDGYVAQGGDVGSFVARILAARYSAKAAHLNFALMLPPANVALGEIDAVEQAGLQRAAAFAAQGDAYAREHGQRPATIGLLLSTSPLALLLWTAEKFLEWADEPLPMDRILDHVSLYWLTETFARSIYPYRQTLGPSPEDLASKFYIDKPVGYSYFPKEIAPIPRAWVATTANLVWSRQHSAGGHFAALERPQDLLQDVYEFVASINT